MAKKFKHKINLFSYYDKDEDVTRKLNQIVNVYEHDHHDFIRNFDEMTEHYRHHLGLGGCTIYALGQVIEFRVVPDQEPLGLPLYKFMINYIMIMPMMLLGVDMTNWEPWTPAKFTASGWMDEMNNIIHKCRGYCTTQTMCQYLEWIKYEMNMFVTRVGDLLAHSISNNEFIELMKRDEEIRKSITCTFDIPENATPDVLEQIAADRTKQLLNTMEGHKDLSCSLYAQTGLFNPGQAMEFFVHLGHKPDLEGNTVPYTSKTNILMGTKDIRAHIVDARGGRKAETIKIKVADAGTFEHSVSTVMAHIRWVDPFYNCDSQHFRVKKITKRSDIVKLDGRVATLDKEEYFIIDPRDPKQQLLGKTIYMKTPITCTHPQRAEGCICSACYGKLLTTVNQDVHIGRISALNNADEMEQKLLSAKHALKTKTSEVQFTDTFDDYFTHENCKIRLSQTIVDAINMGREYDNLYIEINPESVTKTKDGENSHFDKAIDEIIIYNSKTQNRVIIREKNGLRLFIHPYINEEFYFPSEIASPGEPVMIRLRDLVEKDMYGEIFEYQYKNFEIADPLMKLSNILNKGNGGIDVYKTYNECLDSIIPLFVAGGIDIPDIHIEMLIACLIFTKDRKVVDWNDSNPDYKFYSIDTAIKNNPSVLTSLLYKNANQQIAGKYGTYEKTGTSIYDVFLANRKPL